jgi:uncharacterized protein YjdB
MSCAGFGKKGLHQLILIEKRKFMKKYFLLTVGICTNLLALAIGGNTVNIKSGTIVSGKGTVQAVISPTDFVNNGTYIDSTGTLTATAGVTFSGSGTTTLKDLVVNHATGTTTFSSLVSVRGTATIASGTTVATGSGNLYLRTDINASSNLVNNGVLSGTVQGLVTNATATSGACPTYTSTLSHNVSGSSMAYQWQSSTDSASWGNISGATNATYVATVSSTVYYRCSLTTSNSSYAQFTPGKKLLLGSIITGVASQTNVSCFGGSNGAATISASGGTPGYTYVWTPSGGTAATATGLSAGTYSCTVSDAGSCSAVQVVTITQPGAAVGGSTFVSNVSCNGGTNGTINLTPSGGTPSYTFNWGGGITSEDRTGLAVGSYSCVVTDANGCSGTVTATVTQPSALGGSTSVTNVSCNGGSNGSIDLTPTGGTPSYTYSWGGGITTQDRTGLSFGSYSCVVTDANGCSGTVTATVTQPSALGGSTFVTNVSCNGGTNGSIDLTPSGGTPGYTYAWGGGVTTQDRTGLAAGSYSCVVTDANGCTGTVTATVTQPSAVTGSTSRTNVSCFGGSNGAINLTPSGGTPSYIYNWGGGITTEDRTGLAAGTYSCIVTDANACTGTVTATITQPASAVGGSTVVTNVSCFGGSNGAINLTPSGGTPSYTFNWGSGITAEDRTGLAAGTYTCVVTDANSCTGTVTATVTQPASAVGGSTTVTNVSCFGGSNGAINLTPSGGTPSYTFNWGGGITTEDRTGLAAGTYTCVVTDANSCTSTVTATVTQPVSAVGGSTVVTNVSCFGGSNGAINLTASGGTPSYTYNWGGGITTEDRTGLVAGTYTCVVTDANSCTGTVTATVTQPASAVGGSTSVTNVTCSGGTNGAINLTPSGGTPAYTFNWGGGITTEDRTGLVAGTYTCIVTDANSCTGTVTATVTQPSGISATISNTNVSCFGFGDGTATVVATGGTGSLTYSWAPTGGSAASATGLSAGTYTCTVSDASSCSLNKIATVTEPAALTINTIANNGPVCSGTTLNLSTTVSGGTLPYSYSWSGPNSFTSTLQNPSVASPSVTATGTYSLSFTDANGCSATGTNTTNAIVNARPVAVISASPNPTLPSLAVNFSSSTPAVSSYIWSYGDGGSSTLSTPSHNYATAASYTATLAVTDTNGCTATATTVVTVTATVGPIGGNPSFCIGDLPVALTHPISGGTWSSSNTSIATVGSSSGLVTGIAPGTAMITYSLGGSYYQTKIALIYPLPVPITGSAATCEGTTSGLYNTSIGSGSWSSSNTSVATIGTGSGVVTGISLGTTTITYTLYSGCFITRTHSVNTTPAPITGASFICATDSVTFTSTPTGGSWTSSNTGVAVADGSTGTIVGIAGGTSTISYALSTGCARSMVITTGSLPNTITGTLSLCAGGTSTLGTTTTGGTWSSSDAGVATIGSTTGLVTAVSTGTATISYTLGTGCRRIVVVTVNAAPAASTGTTDLCAGGTTVLENATTGGTWSSSSTSIATVGSLTGIINGLTAGTANITYRVSGPGCFSVTQITVNASPAAITGTTNACIGATSTLSHTTTGGTWVSSNTGIATIDASSGVVTGVAAGTVAITYNISATCFKTTSFTVKALPTSFGGSASICQGGTSTLSSTPVGGTWTSSDVSVAMINSISGIATGVSVGNATITYTITNGCYRTAEVTVNPLPSSITGGNAVCIGSTISLSNSTSGGSWLSGNVARATVDTFSGVVTGVTAGTVTISYVLSTGCRSTIVVSVGTMPAAITGTLSLCAGNTTTLSSTTGGGTWSSSDVAVASTGSGTGTSTIVSGVNTGTAGISYTVTGCSQIAVVTVNAGPGSITGSSSLCVGSNTTLTAATSGGTWTSGSSAVASVGSATGIVTGSVSGVTTITYRTSATCFSTYTVTVISTPTAITGTMGVCVGFTTALSHSTTGGSWSSSNTTVATVDGSTGVVSGLATGTSTITYTISDGCYKTATITVYGLPPAIGGTAVLCQSSATTLTNTLSGGTWSSSNTSVATVGTSSGMVSGVSGGTATITYRVTSTGCYNIKEVTVNALPATISGLSSICAGAPDTLSNTTTGGTWTSSAPAIVAIGSATGIASGVNAGNAIISYTLSTGCRRTFNISVNALPSSISGSLLLCVGNTTTLTSATAGQTWSSSNTSVATVGSATSTTGLVSGVNAGSAVISYTNAAGCYRIANVTVNAALPANVGENVVCVGQSIALTNSTTGGTWTSSVAAKATVGISTGIVNGIAVGTTNITYSTGGGCSSITQVTVNAAPAVITGTLSVCVGQTTTLSDATSGGSWISGNTAKATVNTSTGVVTGVSAGTVIITYYFSTGCYKTTSITVKANPASIAGATSVAIGSSVTLTNTSPSGTWSSSNTAIATVGSLSGVVNGINTGSVTITYRVPSTGCYSTQSMTVDTVVARPFVAGATNGQTKVFSIYPNPTSGTIYVNTATEGTFVIYSVDGRAVVTRELITGSTQVQLPTPMAAGMYLCRFTDTAGNINTTRLVFEP